MTDDAFTTKGSFTLPDTFTTEIKQEHFDQIEAFVGDLTEECEKLGLNIYQAASYVAARFVLATYVNAHVCKLVETGEPGDIENFISMTRHQLERYQNHVNERTKSANSDQSGSGETS